MSRDVALWIFRREFQRVGAAPSPKVCSWVLGMESKPEFRTGSSTPVSFNSSSKAVNVAAP